jgi:ribosome-associated protein
MNIKTNKAIKGIKSVKGYWSNGRFVKPEEIALEEVGPPSKTQLKAEAGEKQALGEALLTLRADLMARLDLPDKLLDALAQAKRITSFEGRRRQMQFIGKLMRPLDAAPIQEAINEQLGGSAQLTLMLHLAEQWRDKLVASDDALGTWLTEHPETDAQQLRALIRQARKDAKPEKPESAGEAPRHGKPYREIFQLVKQALAAESEGKSEASGAAQEPKA